MIAVSVIGVAGPGRIRLNDCFHVDSAFVQKVTEFLQLSSDSVFAFTANFAAHLSGVRHIGPKTQEVDSLGQGEYGRFLVQFQSKRNKILPDFFQTILKIFLVVVYQIEVVHITAIEFDSQTFLDHVVHSGQVQDREPL